MMEWQVLSDGALVGHPFKLSFPLAGMDCLNHWIPACAGMMKELDPGFHQDDRVNPGFPLSLAGGAA